MFWLPASDGSLARVRETRLQRRRGGLFVSIRASRLLDAPSSSHISFDISAVDESHVADARNKRSAEFFGNQSPESVVVRE